MLCLPMGIIAVVNTQKTKTKAEIDFIVAP
jgi:hypothetical protein